MASFEPSDQHILVIYTADSSLEACCTRACIPVLGPVQLISTKESQYNELTHTRQLSLGVRVSNKKGPKTGKDKFLLENASDLFQDESFDLAHIFEDLLSILLPTNFSLDTYFL